MAEALDKGPPDPLSALADLEDHLQHAAQVLKVPPYGKDDPPSEAGPPLSRLFATAHAALERFAEFVTERRFPPGGTPRIVLRRLGHRVTVVTGGATREDVAMFIAALRLSDQRLLDTTELIGLLLGLAVKWAASGFAPPVILVSLKKAAPRILELGKDLVSLNEPKTTH